MTIHVIPGKGYDSNIYLIDGTEPTIIDTGTGLNHGFTIDEIQSRIDPTQIKQIVLTHEHYDHTGGTNKLVDFTNDNACIIAHPYTKEKVKDGISMFAQMLGGTMPKITVNKTVNHGDELHIGNVLYTVYHTPGHTPGCICLYSKKLKTLFSGDTVFSHGSFGRTDFPGGNLSDLQSSIKTLSTLDVNELYPGHESIIKEDANQHIARSHRNIHSFF